MHELVTHIKHNKHEVYVGRPTKWGNPFVIGIDGTRKEVIAKYYNWLITTQPDLIKQAKNELRGMVLGCHCAPQSCHADVLAEIANANELIYQY